MMQRVHLKFLVMAVSAASLMGCVRNEPATPATQVVIQPPMQQTQVLPSLSPAPPPLAHSELVPPPPPGAGAMVWQPGHWRYTAAPGNPWQWQPGGYMPPPPGQTTWVPGRWAQQPTGGWMWIEGHWA